MLPRGGAAVGGGGGQVAARGAPADPTVLYATVPPGVRPGDVLAVEAPDADHQAPSRGRRQATASRARWAATHAARPSPARAAGLGAEPGAEPGAVQRSEG